MHTEDHEWFNELPDELKNHLWEHRSEPLSPEILLALVHSDKTVSGLNLFYTPGGHEFRLDYEVWEYIWTQMSGPCSATSGCSCGSASARLELLNTYGNKA